MGKQYAITRVRERRYRNISIYPSIKRSCSEITNQNKDKYLLWSLRIQLQKKPHLLHQACQFVTLRNVYWWIVLDRSLSNLAGPRKYSEKLAYGSGHEGALFCYLVLLSNDSKSWKKIAVPSWPDPCVVVAHLRCTNLRNTVITAMNLLGSDDIYTWPVNWGTIGSGHILSCIWRNTTIWATVDLSSSYPHINKLRRDLSPNTIICI